MNEVIRAAAGLQAVCEAEGWRFCFIGSRFDQTARRRVGNIRDMGPLRGDARFIAALRKAEELRRDARIAFLQAEGDKMLSVKE